MVPSSAALQNINGMFGAVASLLTRPAWQLNTCVNVASVAALMSWTLILQSAAPVTTIESLEFGKNFKKNKKMCAFFCSLIIFTKNIKLNRVTPNLDREYISLVSCSHCSHCLVQKRIPNYHLHIVGPTRYQSVNISKLYAHWCHEHLFSIQSAAWVIAIESLEFWHIVWFATSLANAFTAFPCFHTRAATLNRL